MPATDTSFESFVDKAVDHVKAELSAFGLPENDSELRSSVAARCDAAMDFGMETEAEIMMLVDLGYRTEMFDEKGPVSEVVKEVLTADYISNDAKFEKLREIYAMNKAFDQLEQQSDEK